MYVKHRRRRRENDLIHLLLVVGVILSILWVLGLVSSYTLGGFIHVALVIGLFLVVLWFFFGVRRRR
jgi:hypothetical protein